MSKSNSTIKIIRTDAIQLVDADGVMTDEKVASESTTFEATLQDSDDPLSQVISDPSVEQFFVDISSPLVSFARILSGSAEVKLTNDSLGVGYDPYDDDSETGYQRPPRLVGCVSDYFDTIMRDCDIDNPWPHQEFEAMLQSPYTFFTDMDVFIANVPATSTVAASTVVASTVVASASETPIVRQDDDVVAVLTRKSTGRPIPRAT